jgi:hypothetical protein
MSAVDLRGSHTVIGREPALEVLFSNAVLAVKGDGQEDEAVLDRCHGCLA